MIGAICLKLDVPDMEDHMCTFIKMLLLKNQLLLVSISAQLLNSPELSLRRNAEPKIKSNVIVMRQCMEIEIGATEVVNLKQEEDTRAKRGQARVLIDILERYIPTMELMETTISAEILMDITQFGAILLTLERAGIHVILFQEIRMPACG